MAGERLAEIYLTGRGVRILARRVKIGAGELDLIGSAGGQRVAFEVRSITGPADPLDAFGRGKFDQVWRLALRAGCTRVDLVAIGFRAFGAEVRWVPGIRR